MQALLDRVVQSFTTQLRQLVREHASAQAARAVRIARRGAGRARVGLTGRGGRQRRSPEVIAKQAARLLKYITAHPGQRAEQIANAIRLPTGEMQLLLRKLLADKKIKAAGKARGTTYTAGGK